MSRNGPGKEEATLFPTLKVRAKIGDLPLLSIEKETRAALVQLDEFLSQPFHARDLTITSRP